jgi:hypothetical protein
VCCPPRDPAQVPSQRPTQTPTMPRPHEFKVAPYERGIFAVIVFAFIFVAGVNTVYKMKTGVS